MKLQTFLLLLFALNNPMVQCEQKSADPKLTLDKWTYIQVDDSRDNYIIPGGQPWWNYFGLDMYDINQDGYMDIIEGEWYYRNPGGDRSTAWERITFPIEVDAVLALDVEGDEFAEFRHVDAVTIRVADLRRGGTNDDFRRFGAGEDFED